MCGIFGKYSFDKDHIAKTVYYGLFALQHRGQESAGIAVSNGSEIKCHKEMGLVNVVFNSEEKIRKLDGSIGIGHVRYSTTGSSTLSNAQPIVVDTKFGPIALAHNGNLINTEELRIGLQGFKFNGTTDSEVIAALISFSNKDTLEEALIESLEKVQGAYALLVMSKDKLIAVKDPQGIRPLCIGKLEGGYIFSSESCGLDIVGASFVRELEGGEMAVVDRNGLQSKTIARSKKCSFCIFEFIYFARLDSVLNGRSVYGARVAMGKLLAKQQPAPTADFISGVPDSGIPAAVGFSSESKIDFGDSLIKNRYVGRTFIQPSQDIRDMGVKVKLNPLKQYIQDSKLVIIDDSIVRGTTSRQIVKIIKECGAREVHFRVSSPPIISPCYYGIDTLSKSELIAANLSIEGIRKYLDADSLGYLSLEGLVKAVNLPQQSMCMACLNNHYPVEIPEKLGKLN